MARQSGAVAAGREHLPAVRQQLADPLLRVHLYAEQDVREVLVRVDAFGVARGDQLESPAMRIALLFLLCACAGGGPREPDDVRVLRRAESILVSEAVWDRADDRVCNATDTKWSLYCALEKASIEVLGKFDHRGLALEEVRVAIDEISGPGRFQHRLMDFNNLPTTTFDDVRHVLRLALERAQHRSAKER